MSRLAARSSSRTRVNKTATNERAVKEVIEELRQAIDDVIDRKGGFGDVTLNLKLVDGVIEHRHASTAQSTKTEKIYDSPA